MAMFKRAEWATWELIPEVHLWQAVALSVGFEPEPYSVLESLQRAAEYSGRAGPARQPGPEEFKRRLRIAEANISSEGGLVGTRFVESRRHCSVNLRQFGAWARGVGLSLPEQFPMPIEMAGQTPAPPQDAGTAADVPESPLQAEVRRLHNELVAARRALEVAQREASEIRKNELTGKGRTTALKIIGGVLKSAYRMDIHATRLEGIGEVVKDVGIDEKTLRAWIKEAAQAMDKGTTAT